MQALVSLWEVHCKSTQVLFALLPTHLMVYILSLAQGTKLLGCGVQALVNVLLAVTCSVEQASTHSE